MNPPNRKIIESILLLADEPVPTGQIAEVLEISAAQVQGVLELLRDEYIEQDKGFVLRESASGWRLYSSADCSAWLERFVLGHRQGRLSGAALEVLAVIAYKQPVSRAEVAEIRGVDSDRVIKTLLQRELIIEVGRDLGPGSPALFTVSDSFLERMGLRSVEDLPPLVGFMPDTDAVEDMEAKLSPGSVTQHEGERLQKVMARAGWALGAVEDMMGPGASRSTAAAPSSGCGSIHLKMR